MRYAGQEVEEGAKRVFLCAEALVGRNVHHKRRPLWLLHGNSRWLLDAELLLAVFTREGIAVVYEQLSAERIHSAANGEVACVVVRGVVFVVVEKSVRGSCELLPSQQGGEGIPAPALVLVCLMPLQDFNGVVREEEVDNIVQFLEEENKGESQNSATKAMCVCRREEGSLPLHPCCWYHPSSCKSEAPSCHWRGTAQACLRTAW
mmetsp:Transcript_20483/g.52620  ORF Transcript_20483/g.52620 Transcript_20483/m.52620 type:complete len:205 (-) Transcript_20483:720-1334(-)